MTKDWIYPKGVVEVVVNYYNQNYRLPLLVLSEKGPNLVGRDWLEKVRLDWLNVRRSAQPGLGEVLNKYDHLFKEELGTLQGIEANIHVDPSVKPIFHSARRVP